MDATFTWEIKAKNSPLLLRNAVIVIVTDSIVVISLE